ncbi:hypothetical protein [Lentibacillus sp. CBA3610]|uniref:hypothetical protein n=1 Tax=Lentibacillus sp. CBA3610 TaxID=2518176 RepID=UPI0015955CCC|nr:hypothetical protein [Lentibacillus sp. CBA3610]QKY69419.1 hypothetical protein Len3610_07265 [Lentibacillus sp. CBA3610]
MLSPFSIEQPWTLHWQRLPSNLKPIHYVNDKSPKERAALDALAKVGIIGGKQLFRLFRLQKKRLKQMVREQKIVRHEMRCNKQIMPVYTLGQTGAVITNVSYEPNYWVAYRLSDVLKRLVFFELYQYFQASTIVPAPEPFAGAIERNGKLFYIYSARGDVEDLMMHLKWQGPSLNERLIVITEAIKHLEPLKMYAKAIKLRVTTDEDLMASGFNFANMFYFLDERGEIVKET